MSADKATHISISRITHVLCDNFRNSPQMKSFNLVWVDISYSKRFTLRWKFVIVINNQIRRFKCKFLIDLWKLSGVSGCDYVQSGIFILSCAQKFPHSLVDFAKTAWPIMLISSHIGIYILDYCLSLLSLFQ